MGEIFAHFIAERGLLFKKSKTSQETIKNGERQGQRAQ